ncbi:MAG: hypothetical protein FWE19_08780, partial [Oscillospiraceae bacterium]|nr:hypothetical protein [Oscillospiraceae bacterium]
HVGCGAVSSIEPNYRPHPPAFDLPVGVWGSCLRSTSFVRSQARFSPSRLLLLTSSWRDKKSKCLRGMSGTNVPARRLI